jgi:hypothetical protein
MFEAWEYRSQDVDLIECRRIGIPVLGTNEKHPDLDIFGYVGMLAMKLLLQLDVELFRSQLLVLGGTEFGSPIAEALRGAGASVTWVDPREPGWEMRVREVLSSCDALVVGEQKLEEVLIGRDGRLSGGDLREINPGLVVAHVAGGVEQGELEAAGIDFRPEYVAPPRYMSVATDYVGPRPLIDLHTAGLKVGERLARARKNDLPGVEAELVVLQETTLAQRVLP